MNPETVYLYKVILSGCLGITIPAIDFIDVNICPSTPKIQPTRAFLASRQHGLTEYLHFAGEEHIDEKNRMHGGSLHKGRVFMKQQ